MIWGISGLLLIKSLELAIIFLIMGIKLIGEASKRYSSVAIINCDAKDELRLTLRKILVRVRLRISSSRLLLKLY